MSKYDDVDNEFDFEKEWERASTLLWLVVDGQVGHKFTIQKKVFEDRPTSDLKLDTWLDNEGNFVLRATQVND